MFPVRHKYYATPEEARQAIGDAARQRGLRSARRDLCEIFPLLPEVFGAREVGQACRSIGHMWSDLAGIITRGEKTGTLERLPAVLVGRRLLRQWRKTGAEPSCSRPSGLG